MPTNISIQEEKFARIERQFEKVLLDAKLQYPVLVDELILASHAVESIKLVLLAMERRSNMMNPSFTNSGLKER